jgi:predicted  nucleic acid-binding Zn-ribbon protein
MGKLVDAVKNKEKLLADRDADVQALRDSLAKDGEVARGKMNELEEKIAAIRTERDKIAAGVRPDVLKRYGAIRMRRGLAVVAVRSGTCTGCNMNMPPQLYNTLQRGTSLETCPYCHRMIYWDELMKEQKDAPAPEAAKGEKPEKSAERR